MKNEYVLILTDATWKKPIGYWGNNSRGGRSCMATREDAVKFTSRERAMDMAKRDGLGSGWKVKALADLA